MNGDFKNLVRWAKAASRELHPLSQEITEKRLGRKQKADLSHRILSTLASLDASISRVEMLHGEVAPYIAVGPIALHSGNEKSCKEAAALHHGVGVDKIVLLITGVNWWNIGIKRRNGQTYQKEAYIVKEDNRYRLYIPNKDGIEGY